MAQAAAASRVPLRALKMAKRGGCDGFMHNKVDMGRFIAWWFSNEATGEDWSDELKKAQALRERIRLSEDQERVIDFGAVHEFHRALVGALFSDLDRIFCNELPPALKGQTEIRIRTRCARDIERLKRTMEKQVQEFSRNGQPH